MCLGVAPIGRSDNPLAHALATAEIACKAAKDRGRNRVEMFQDSDQSIIRRHTDILVIGKLREALDSDGFRLDAQPILPLRGNYGRPRFELLIRMLGRTRRNDSAREVSVLGGTLSAHADDRSLGGAPRLRTAGRT